jgi:hypothetical protein
MTLLMMLACGAGTLPPGAPLGDGSVHYAKVDLYLQEGENTEDYDVRLIFNPVAGNMSVTGEDDTSVKYATIPYSAIQNVTYSYTKSPRWKTGAGIALAVGIFALPIFFMKSKKHWLTVAFHDVPEHPEGGLLFRLDKDNFASIIGTLEGQSGVRVERVIED